MRTGWNGMVVLMALVYVIFFYRIVAEMDFECTPGKSWTISDLKDYLGRKGGRFSWQKSELVER